MIPAPFNYIVFTLPEGEQEPYARNVLLPLLKADVRKTFTVPSVDQRAPWITPEGWEEVTPEEENQNTRIDAVFGKGTAKRVWYYPEFRGELFPYFEVAGEAFAYSHACVPVQNFKDLRTHFIRPIGTQDQIKEVKKDVPTDDEEPHHE